VGRHALSLGLAGLAAAVGVVAVATAARDDAALAAPPEWRELPALAEVAAEGDAEGPLRVVERRGLGDPGRGCYALLQVVEAPDAPAPDAIAAALAAELGATVGADGALAFADGEARGALALRIERRGDDATIARALACWHDGREPTRCARGCAALRAGFEGAR
jgi:hypothetical protein